MGEAKRRKETDPDYGKKRHPVPEVKRKGEGFSFSKISRTELIIWAVLLAMLAATFAATLKA